MALKKEQTKFFITFSKLLGGRLYPSDCFASMSLPHSTRSFGIIDEHWPSWGLWQPKWVLWEPGQPSLTMQVKKLMFSFL